MNHLSGIIPINKPSQVISKDISRKIERRFGKLKIGHVGTLDPMASGVLVLLIGNATKLQDKLVSLPKRYDCDLEFGVETDTLDLDGEIIRKAPVPELSTTELTTIVNQFVGNIRQIPPLFSAVKLRGVPLYKLARAGKAPEDLEGFAREVKIEEITVTNWQTPVLTLDIYCHKGTYVRSLARDIALQAQTVAVVSRLVRTEAAGFCLGDCVSLEDLLEKDQDLPSFFWNPSNKASFTLQEKYV